MTRIREITEEHFTLLHSYGLAMASDRTTLETGAAVLHALSLITQTRSSTPSPQALLRNARATACELELPSCIDSPYRDSQSAAFRLLIAIIDEQGPEAEKSAATALAHSHPLST